MASQILAYFVLAFSCFVIVSSSNGTTANLQSIFLGRCNEYIGLKSATMSQILAGKNCSSLYNEFTVVFKDKTTCQTKYDGIFDRFFKLIDPGPSPENKALFWSGTMNVAHSLSDVSSDYMTLEDTFPGFVANGLSFCGEGRIGFNYDNCKCSWKDSQSNVFWRSASKQFARNAVGTISVLVNGTRDDGRPAFRRDSIFAEVELPNLNTSVVKRVRILVGMDLNEEPKEKCGTKSIITMQKLIEKRNIQVTCLDDPRIVLSILCTKYPNAGDCKKHWVNKNEEGKWKILALVFIAVSALLLIILLMVVLGRRKLKKNLLIED